MTTRLRHPTNSQLDYMDRLAVECGFHDGKVAALALFGLVPGPETITRILNGLRARRDLPVLRSGMASLTFKKGGGEVGQQDFLHVVLFAAASGPTMLECRYEVHDAKTGEVSLRVRTFHWSAVVDIAWH